MFYGIVVIFCFRCGETLKTVEKTKERLNIDEIKKQLIESIIINNTIEVDNLNKLAEKVQKPEDAADIIKQYEEIIRTKKGITSVAYHQGKILKRFHKKEKFIQMASKLKIHKSTIIFKINVFKLIEKHPKLIKSSVTLTF